MSDLKAKMHQIRFRLALRPTPRWGAYIASPDPLVRFKGPTSKRREGRGEEGRGGERWKGRGDERRVGDGGNGKRTPSVPPAPNLPLHHCYCL